MEAIFKKYKDNVDQSLTQISHNLHKIETVVTEGKLLSAKGTVVAASLIPVKIGDMCIIDDRSSNLSLYAEVIAIDREELKLMPYGTIARLSKEASVRKFSDEFKIAIGNWAVSKIFDGLGTLMRSIDAADQSTVDVDAENNSYYPVIATPPNALNRPIITQQLLTGVKSIDLFMSVGLGQRLAIFAGAGMGKTTTMGMIIRNSSADVVVIALIGERGREVQEFIDLEFTEEMRKKCVLIVATSDRPPVEQIKAGYVAHTIAEYFRDQGKNVLLLIDSITRFARAQREVGLSAGEPPTRGGYPPSVFLSFPKLMERAGVNDKGSITAFYTVLTESDSFTQDPIADEVKSIVDGHIVLSRQLVEQSHFPAIDILKSLSRIADRIISKEHLLATRKVRALLSKFDELEFLIRVGEYKKGNDAFADEAIDKHQSIMNFLKQGIHETFNFQDELRKLINLAR